MYTGGGGGGVVWVRGVWVRGGVSVLVLVCLRVHLIDNRERNKQNVKMKDLFQIYLV